MKMISIKPNPRGPTSLSTRIARASLCIFFIACSLLNAPTTNASNTECPTDELQHHAQIVSESITEHWIIGDAPGANSCVLGFVVQDDGSVDLMGVTECEFDHAQKFGILRAVERAQPLLSITTTGCAGAKFGVEFRRPDISLWIARAAVLEKRRHAKTLLAELRDKGYGKMEIYRLDDKSGYAVQSTAVRRWEASFIRDFLVNDGYDAELIQSQ